jgi:hypothetical protein
MAQTKTEMVKMEIIQTAQIRHSLNRINLDQFLEDLKILDMLIRSY